MEQMILGWLQNNVPLVATWIISLGLVWKLVEKYSPRIFKGINIARKALDLVDTFLTAAKDKKIDQLEIEAIEKEYNELMEALK
jgi:hypothetical protein